MIACACMHGRRLMFVLTDSAYVCARNSADDCFDEFKYLFNKEIGYFRNNRLWDGQHYTNDVLIAEFINGKVISPGFFTAIPSAIESPKQDKFLFLNKLNVEG